MSTENRQAHAQGELLRRLADLVDIRLESLAQSLFGGPLRQKCGEKPAIAVFLLGSDQSYLADK